MLLKKDNYPTVLHIAAIGSAAVISQTILIRELLGLFRMTETTIGLLLACWLFWSGTGGLISGRLSRLDRKTNSRLLRIVTITVGSVLPLTILLIRAGRGILASPPGALPAFTPSIILSFAVTAGPGLLFGSAYSAASLGISRGREGIRGGVGKVYIAEAAGAALGAIVFSILMSSRMTHLSSSLWLSVFMIIAACVPFERKRSAILPVLLLGLVTVGLANSGQIDEISKKGMFGGYDRIITEPSKYGELVAARSEGSTSFYSGGSRLFSYPEPERAEETVHLPLLSHPCPKKVLLVGGSLGGVVEMVLAHPSVDTLHCVEIDVALTSLFEKFYGVTSYADDAKVSRLFLDGRRYISTASVKYDLIIVNPPVPLNLQWNRYFTTEFFEKSRRLLRGGGIMTISHPSSEDYIGQQLGRVLSCLKITMDSVFDSVSVLPGSRAHFIAGRADVSMDTIMARMKERRLGSDYISEAFIPERLSRDRVTMMDEILRPDNRVRVNRDSYPVLPFYELVLESRKRDRKTSSIFELVAGLNEGIIPCAVILLAMITLLFRRQEYGGIKGVSIAGFSAFVIQMILIFRFQSAAGVVYHALIALSALFMAGAAMGAVWMLHVADETVAWRRRLHLSVFASLLIFLALTTIDSPARELLEERQSVYYLFSLINGLLTGAYYHHSVLRVPGRKIEKVPAVYYSADLLGACAGGLVAGLVILPVSGIYWTGGMVLSVNLAAALILKDPR